MLCARACRARGSDFGECPGNKTAGALVHSTHWPQAGQGRQALVALGAPFGVQEQVVRKDGSRALGKCGQAWAGLSVASPALESSGARSQQLGQAARVGELGSW